MRAILITAALALAVPVAGCGSNTTPLSERAFADRAGAICADLWEEVDDDADFAAGVPAIERAAARLHALAPPAAFRSRVARWLRGFDGALAVMRAPDPSWEAYAPHGKAIEDGAWALGIHRCAGPEATAPPRAARVTYGTAVRDVVIDTDMGSDDWMAILYLLRRPDVRVRAITVSGTGLAHCGPGVRNARGLLRLAGRRAPVACGRERPLRGARRFPAAWRRAADGLLGLHLPGAPAGDTPRSAPALLASALREPRPVSVLALGPLTNVADAFARHPGLARRPAAVYVMGGAFAVPGNTPGAAAEWNFHVDPAAADAVLRSGAPVTLVPLDATNQVPLTRSFYEGIAADHDTPVARFVYDVLARQRDELDGGGLFFWDQLAAVALAGDVAAFTRRDVNVTRRGALAGWTSEGSGGARVRVAGRVDRPRFERVFLSVLAAQPGSGPAS